MIIPDNATPSPLVEQVIDRSGKTHGYRVKIRGRWFSSQSKDVLEALARGEKADQRRYRLSNMNKPERRKPVKKVV